MGASNGAFAGRADVYADADAPAELAAVLRGFPAGRDDSREFVLGSFDPAHAGGGAAPRFYCSDALGHAAVEVRLRASAPGGGAGDAVALHVALEAAAVDSFVAQPSALTGAVGQSALLEAAT